MQEKIYVHYGHKRFDPTAFNEIKNRMFVKPDGGLWASDINAEYGWKNWCKDNDFRECNEDNSFKFKLKQGSKILELKSKKDLIGLPMENIPYKFSWYTLDFEQLKQNYDAIEVYIDELYFDLYGWDCDSLLVLNKECIELIEERRRKYENKL